MKENYLPLFRKYRPQSFQDIIGQESLVKALSNAIELNRIANAYLFCGPRGTGKTSSARIFAKSLNCVNGPTLTPCQKCASCVDITNAAGLDVIEIDAASNRGIQDAKELISQVQYAPINGKYKIFIIDEVHMLSNDAFNALLKTFEEPPENVIFILATTEPHKVLETIVSRCQRFDLRRITTEDIIKRLRQISDLENIKITDEALFTIAKNVSGGLRDSLALLDQVSILGVKEEITKELIEDLLGKINFDTLLNLLKDINDENIELALHDVDNIYAKGNEPRNLAENFIEFLKNTILTLNSTDDSSITKFTTLIKEDIEKIRTLNLDKNKTIKILNTIIEYYKEIKISTNPYLWMELAVIGACKLDLQNIQNPASTAPILQTQKTQNTTAEIQKPIIKQEIQDRDNIEQNQKNDTDEENQAVIEKINFENQKEDVVQNSEKLNEAEAWTKIVNAIPSLPAKAFYSGVSKLVKIENQKITLGFLNENLIIQAKSSSKLPLLQAGVDATYKGFKIEFIKIDSSQKTIEVKPKISSNMPKRPPEIPISNQNENTEASYDAIKTDKEDKNEEQKKENEKKYYSPKVQEMIEQFNGRIIE